MLTVPRADPSLYTIATDDVVRIWSPVIDDPTWFQMVWCLGMRQYGVGGITTRRTLKGQEIIESGTSTSSSSKSLPCFIVDYPIIRSMRSDTEKAAELVSNGGANGKGRKSGVEMDDQEEMICWCEEDGSLWKATLPVSRGTYLSDYLYLKTHVDMVRNRMWKRNPLRFCG